MLKLKYLTAATLLAIAGQAGAATVGITDGSPDDFAVEGNGEFILTVWDEVRQISYVRQLEMFLNDFVPSNKVGVGGGTGDATPETGLSLTFAGDATFVSSFSASNPNDIKWHVSAADVRLLPGESQSTPDALVILSTSPTTSPSTTASVSGMSNAGQQWDLFVGQVNTTGCGTGTGTSCTTTDPSSPAFGAVFDTTAFGLLGSTILGLDTDAFFVYTTGKAGSPAITKPTRTVFENSAGQGIFSLSADGTLTYNIPAIPVPAAVWLLGSGLLGLVGVARRKQSA